MKNTLLLTISLFFITATGFSQIEKAYPVQPFTEIEASGVMDIYLKYGSEAHVLVKSKKDISDFFIVENQGEKLIIKQDKKFSKQYKRGYKMDVYITYNNLKGIVVEGVADLMSKDTLKADKMELKHLGVGDVKLAIKSKNLEVKKSGVGTADLFLEVTNLTLKKEGVGKITLSGTAQNTIIKKRGVGELNAEKLVIQKLDINKSGMGKISVNVEKELSADIDGLGDFSYKGNPNIKELKVNKITKVNN